MDYRRVYGSILILLAINQCQHQLEFSWKASVLLFFFLLLFAYFFLKLLEEKSQTWEIRIFDKNYTRSSTRAVGLEWAYNSWFVCTWSAFYSFLWKMTSRLYYKDKSTYFLIIYQRGKYLFDYSSYTCKILCSLMMIPSRPDVTFERLFWYQICIYLPCSIQDFPFYVELHRIKIKKKTIF
jgi:hypothetical protein